MTILLKEKNINGLSEQEIKAAVERSLAGRNLKVLLVGPDITRFHSNAGFIINCYYHLLKDKVEVEIMPALGTHEPMTELSVKKCTGIFL